MGTFTIVSGATIQQIKSLSAWKKSIGLASGRLESMPLQMKTSFPAERKPQSFD
jgi:hypothetical protein